MDNKDINDFYNSRKRELFDFHKNEQIKYAYYTVGLCVAAIGYAANLTIDKKINMTHVPLALAILLWSISTYLGLVYLQRALMAVVADKALMNIRHAQALKTSKISEEEVTNFKTEMKRKNAKTSKYGIWHFRLFIWGILLFLVWRIVDMSVTVH
ncbi:MAG: hypothetical protein WC756_00215 [Taibaiella sp.]|jgi:hypothetical protein